MTEELVGIDVGGTFTDFVWLVDGALKVQKVPTTPADQSRAMVEGLEMLGVDAQALVVHGTTVATNALLERKGAKTALLTTKGFRDVLAIGRQNRPHLYQLSQQRPPDLVPLSLRLEIKERIDATGQLVQPIDESALEKVAAFLREAHVESLAIVFLFSFLNPQHEQRAFEVLSKALKDIHFSVSSELLPEYREYERTATTVINAYVQPLVARYVDQLRQSLGSRPVRVMQSSGGAINLIDAASQPARLVLSGPAGGIVGAFQVARQALKTDTPKLLTFDMGGTSTDVALCPGSLPRTSESEITGLPLRFPSTDIHTVGAGGGSIAWVDDGGVLRVGPHSAGAVPGPACYGRGGTSPTVTDANLVLGRLDANGMLDNNSTLQLHTEKARNAVAQIGDILNLSVEETALGIVRVANATMERALRRVSVERGFNPRNYTLIPFGGAGPLHACDLADALDVRHIFIPRHPGVLSALGLLMADVTYDASHAVLQSHKTLLQQPELLNEAVQKLSEKVFIMLADQGEGKPTIEARLDMRYRGQSFELEVLLPLPLSDEGLRESLTHFHAAHEQRYGYSLLGEEVDVVTLRVIGRLPGRQPALTSAHVGEADLQKAMVGEVMLWFDGNQHIKSPCYDRQKLEAGSFLQGPCLVLQYDTTLLISGFWEGVVDDLLNISLWRTGHAPLEEMPFLTQFIHKK